MLSASKNVFMPDISPFASKAPPAYGRWYRPDCCLRFTSFCECHGRPDDLSPKGANRTKYANNIQTGRNLSYVFRPLTAS